MIYLVDANVFREIGRDSAHPNVVRWLDSIVEIDLAVSTITIREIRRGVEVLRINKPETAVLLEQHVAKVLTAFERRVLPIDEHVADVWGRMLAVSNKHIDDTALAATAQVHGLTVATRNARDFRGRGVALIDPYKSPPSVTAAS